jgi:hypothetical protein
MSVSFCTVNMLQLTVVYVNSVQNNPFEEKETVYCVLTSLPWVKFFC